MRYIFLILWLSFFTVSAQDPLSLSDAISIGLEKNYDIRIERKNVIVADNNNNWGEAGRYPTINLNVSQNNNITDNVKTASPFALQGQIYGNSIAPGVNVNWILFDGFRVNLTKRRLDQLQAESQGNASVVIANTLQSIILGYYLATLEQARLEEFRKQLILSKDKYDYIKTGSDLGTAVTSDVLLEEGNFLTDSLNLINQELSFRIAQRNLNVVLGIENINQQYVLTDSLDVELPDFQLDELENKMLDSNVDLKKQYITQAILGTNIGLTKADRYPSLLLNAGVSTNLGNNDLSRTSLADVQAFSRSQNPDTVFVPDYSQSLSSTTNNYFANFTLSFTLFNGGKINRAIRNSVIQEDIGNIRLDQLKTSLTRDLQEAYDRYLTRKRIYGINERREAAAATNLEISTQKFRSGTINSFDYRVVQNNYLSASIVKLQALYNLMDSKVELMRLTGGLISEHSEPDSATDQ
ncbi:MAG: TolC family protein [Cyclobacteriaceae bacterium]